MMEVGDDIMTIVLDMSEVPYISSAGLRVILNADEIMQDRNGIKLTGVNNDVRAIFEMSNAHAGRGPGIAFIRAWPDNGIGGRAIQVLPPF